MLKSNIGHSLPAGGVCDTFTTPAKLGGLALLGKSVVVSVMFASHPRLGILGDHQGQYHGAVAVESGVTGVGVCNCFAMVYVATHAHF